MFIEMSVIFNTLNGWLLLISSVLNLKYWRLPRSSCSRSGTWAMQNILEWSSSGFSCAKMS